MAILAYKNRALGNGLFTGTIGTWTTNPPISHLGSLQVPTPHAEVTPDAGAIAFTFESQDAAGDPENMTVDVIALLAHTLPEGAVVKFLNNATSPATELAEVTYTAGSNIAAPAYVVAILDSAPGLMKKMIISITGAGSDPVRIGGLWVSTSFRRKLYVGDYSDTPSAFDRQQRVDAVLWPNRRSSIQTVQGSWPGMSESEAIGPDSVNWRDIARQIGYSEPVLLIPIDRRPQDAYYGNIINYAPTTIHRKGLWRGGFTLQTML